MAHGDAELIVKQFGALIDIHLDDSCEGKYETELESFQEAVESILLMNLRNLSLEAFKLPNRLVAVEQHPGLDHPDGLGH